MSEEQNKKHLFIKKSAETSGGFLSKRDKRALRLFLGGALYALGVVAILYIYLSGRIGLSLVAVYLYGLLSIYALTLLNRGYASALRGRLLLSEVVEKSDEARVITDTQGETVYTNIRFRELTNEQENHSLHDFTLLFSNPEKVQKDLYDTQSKALSEGKAHTIEVNATIKGKEERFFITCQTIDGLDGYINWRIDNVTLRYKMQTEIKEERGKLRDFTDNAPVGFFAVDENGYFQFANDTLLRLLGTDTETLIGKTKLHHFLSNPPKNAKAYDCFEHGGLHQHGELLMKGAGDRTFKASITHSITKDVDGNIISRSIVYDLTSEQQMQQALRESQDRFERLFNEAPVGICLLSEDGTISNANQTLASMLQMDGKTLDGKNITDLLDKDFKLRAEDWLKSLINGKRTAPFIEAKLKGATDIVTQIYARKFKTENDLVLHFIDLTEQKNLERQFTQSQKMQAIGQLAGGIAHDFNNLLTAMIGFCDLLLLRHKPGDPSFADIMQIKQNANRAANLVRQLLAFSRQQTLQARVLDMTETLSELSHLLRRLIGVNIDLKLVHGQDIGAVKVDLGQMEQVLVNLVVNARDAMPDGGELTVRTADFNNDDGVKLSSDDILPPGRWVTVAVEDTGTGIDKDIIPHIFEPFFSTKEVGAGTGLGLATVHGIVHQTGGFISVDSKKGKGTTFTIYLPRYIENEEEKEEAPQEEKKKTSDLTGTAKILLVEDEDAVRTFSARALSNKGYQVMDASGGEMALRLLEEGKIDPEILVTDVMMPEMDGTTLAKHVREKYPHVKIIFISGYAEDKFKEHLGGDVYFLPKPFTLKQLATKVKEVIDA